MLHRSSKIALEVGPLDDFVYERVEDIRPNPNKSLDRIAFRKLFPDTENPVKPKEPLQTNCYTLPTRVQRYSVYIAVLALLILPFSAFHERLEKHCSFSGAILFTMRIIAAIIIAMITGR
jgi:hypothetical protein